MTKLLSRSDIRKPSIENLVFENVFAYDNGPGLFEASDETGQRFLGAAVEDDQASSAFVYLPLDPDHLDQVANGKMNFSDALKASRKKVVFCETWNADDNASLVTQYSTKEFPHHLIPQNDKYRDLDEDISWEMV